MDLPHIPKFSSGNSLIVTVKNRSGIWVISEAVAVNRSISCFFSSVVSRPLSIDMYGIVPICKMYVLLAYGRQAMMGVGRNLDAPYLFSALYALTDDCLLM